MGAACLLQLLAGWWGLAAVTSVARYVSAHLLYASTTAAGSEAVGSNRPMLAGMCIQKVYSSVMVCASTPLSAANWCLLIVAGGVGGHGGRTPAGAAGRVVGPGSGDINRQVRVCTFVVCMENSSRSSRQVCTAGVYVVSRSVHQPHWQQQFGVC
jgi:hypothetical protein